MIRGGKAPDPHSPEGRVLSRLPGGPDHPVGGDGPGGSPPPGRPTPIRGGRLLTARQPLQTR